MAATHPRIEPKVLEALGECWGIDLEPKDVDYVTSGEWADVFKADTRSAVGCLAIRVGIRRLWDHIETGLSTDLMDAASAHGEAPHRFLPSGGGDRIELTIRGKTYDVTVDTWVGQHTLEDVPRTAETARAAGQLLGDLHMAARSLPTGGATFDADCWEPVDMGHVLELVALIGQQQSGIAWRELEQVVVKLTRMNGFLASLKSPSEKLVCHSDFRPPNVVQGLDGRLAVVDFDSTHIWTARHELAAATVHFCRQGSQYQVGLASSFVAGYNTVDLAVRLSHKDFQGVVAKYLHNFVNEILEPLAAGPSHHRYAVATSNWSGEIEALLTPEVLSDFTRALGQTQTEVAPLVVAKAVSPELAVREVA